MCLTDGPGNEKAYRSGEQSIAITALLPSSMNICNGENTPRSRHEEKGKFILYNVIY